MPAKTDRSCKLVRDDVEGLMILTITQGSGKKKRRDFYRVERNPNAPRCFTLHKLVHEGEDPVLYDVNADAGTCDCIGHEQWQHCKHLDAIKTLLEVGKLMTSPEYD